MDEKKKQEEEQKRKEAEQKRKEEEEQRRREEEADSDKGEAVERLSLDLRKAAEKMGRAEIRFLVDTYYVQQEVRKAANNQIRATVKAGEPAAILRYFAKQSELLEHQVRGALDRWSGNQKVGRWMRSHTAVGPVITAGLMAHVDIKKARTVGHIYNFAGLNPNAKWWSRKDADAMVKDILSTVGSGKAITSERIAEAARRTGRRVESVEKASRNKNGKITADSFAAGIAKRPWNAGLKTLTWKLGDSFVKFHTLCVCGHWEKNHESGTCVPTPKKDGTVVICKTACATFDRKSFYGKLYWERKQKEVANNAAGKFAALAAHTLKIKNITDPDTLACYKAGKLPPGRIDLRARRWSVKIFISHMHTVLYFNEYGTLPPIPFSFTKAGGSHAHYIVPPNLDDFEGLGDLIRKQYGG